MRVTLTPESAQLLDKKVASGQFHTPSEVIEEGLRLLEAQDRLIELGLEDMRKEIAVGLAQLRRGEKIPGGQVFEEIRRRSQARR